MRFVTTRRPDLCVRRYGSHSRSLLFSLAAGDNCTCGPDCTCCPKPTPSCEVCKDDCACGTFISRIIRRRLSTLLVLLVSRVPPSLVPSRSLSLSVPFALLVSFR